MLLRNDRRIPDSDGCFLSWRKWEWSRRGSLARRRRYAILIIFIISAVVTPSANPWNQTVFAAPMIGLYMLSIGIAWMVAPEA